MRTRLPGGSPAFPAPRREPPPTPRRPRRRRPRQPAREALALAACVLSQRRSRTPWYPAVIEACSRKGDAREAAVWLQEMASSAFRPNVFAFNAVIAGFARRGSAGEAAGWLGRMKAEGLEPNVVSYTAVIDGCAKAGDAAGAVRWFETMLHNSITPNAVSYNAVINGFARLGDTENAVAWLERMRRAMPPDKISYNSALHSCSNAQPPRADEAERLFREMWTEGLDPTASTLSALEKAIGVRRRGILCNSLGVDVERASSNRPQPTHRKVRPLR